MEIGAEEWGRKGATLSDKMARSEYGLTQEQIYAAINAVSSSTGPRDARNPWLRLLRREVEDLVATRSGDRYLRERKARTELAQVNRELKQLQAQLAALEKADGAPGRTGRTGPRRRSSSAPGQRASVISRTSRSKRQRARCAGLCEGVITIVGDVAQQSGRIVQPGVEKPSPSVQPDGCPCEEADRGGYCPMLRAVTRSADGREVVVLGLTEENWRLLSSKPIMVDLRDVGLDVQVVVFRARDTDDLKIKAIELGVADESLHTTPPPTPAEPQMWRRPNRDNS